MKKIIILVLMAILWFGLNSCNSVKKVSEEEKISNKEHNKIICYKKECLNKFKFFDNKYAQDWKYIYLYEKKPDKLNWKYIWIFIKINWNKKLEDKLRKEYCPKNWKIYMNMSTKDGRQLNMPPSYINFNWKLIYYSSSKNFVLDNFCKVKYDGSQRY